MAVTKQSAPTAGQEATQALQAEVEILRARIARLTAAGHEMISTQARMHALLHRASDGIIQFESDGTIGGFNRAAEQIFGRAEVEVLLQHGNELFDVPEQFRDNVPAFLLDYVRNTPDQYKSPLIGRRADGSPVLLEVAVAEIAADDLLLFDDFHHLDWQPQTGYESFMCIVRDISERRHTEDELKRYRENLEQQVAGQVREVREAKETAERSSQAKSDFLASVSHELRTPMHAILSYSEMGLKRLDSVGAEKLGQYFERIHSAGGRLLAMIDELLDLSKAEAGRLHFEIRRADLHATIDEVVAECDGLAERHGLRIVHQSRLADTVAAFDTRRIAQVIRNLVSNAIRFSPEGGVVRISTEDAHLGEGREACPAVQIAVADEGPGIPDGELARVFDRFFQGSQDSAAFGGSGLGLAVVRQIVLAHRGWISAGSSASGGACISVLIPRDPAQRKPPGGGAATRLPAQARDGDE